jgi:hypothetical protein
MRGKKVNKEFVSNFIEESVKNGNSSLSDILEEVNKKLFAIDLKIKEAELSKFERKNLLDVKEFIGKVLHG